jgi:hypothetical protein
MQDSGLAGDHSGNMRIARDTQQFIKRRLAGSVVADSELTNPDDRVQENDIVADTACQRNRWHMVPTRVTPGSKSLFPQRPGLGQQGTCIPRCIVGSQHPDHAGDAGARKITQGDRRNPGFEAGFSAAARNMRVAVNKSGYQSAATQILFTGATARKRIPIIADGNEPAASDQDMTNPKIFGGEDSSIGEKF